MLARWSESDDTILSISAGPRTLLYFRLPLLEVSTLTWSTQNKNEIEKKKTAISHAFFLCIYLHSTTILPLSPPPTSMFSSV